MKAAPSVSPFVVPPFSPGSRRPKPIERFFWWSWHPLYPYWSKSCWGGATEREALKVLDDPESGVGQLDLYHNKLVREDGDGSLVVVLDRPCKRLDVWRKIKRNWASYQPQPTDSP